MDYNLKFHYDKDLPKATILKQQYLINQVKHLQTIPQNAQKSPAWYEMRLSMLSASDWGTILGVNSYANANSVLLKKCGEESYFPKVAMDAMACGNKYEDVAISIYEYRNNKKIIEFGCIRHPSIHHLGASPDGITEDGVMLEIKCPVSRKITGIPPKYYWCQVQGQLEVCELDRCDFLECKFKEYDDEEEYLEDNYNDNYDFNEFGYEKGVIAEFYITNEKKYIYFYSPVNIIGDKLQEWKKSIQEEHEILDGRPQDNIILSSFDYWYLEEISCIPIFRNQEWFNEAKEQLTDFWEEVLYYREMGLEFLKEELNIQKEEKKKIREDKREFLKEELNIQKEEKKKIREDKRLLKKKESDTKKQKKIKDYINLNDSNENNKKDDIETSNTETSNTDSSVEFDDNEKDKLDKLNKDPLETVIDFSNFEF